LIGSRGSTGIREGPGNLEHLPDDPALLKGIVRELLATHDAQQRPIEQLTHRLDLLLKRVYGPRADQLDPNQLSLFEEPTVDNSPACVPPPEPEVITTTKKNGHGRGKLPDDLRRETEIIDVPESVRQATGGEWVPIGEELSETLDDTPSSLFVRRIVRPKYVVRFPDSDRPDALKIADLPPEALPKSKAAPGLVADVIVSKLVDHLPLYRQEQRSARQGFAIARSTLCGWLAEAADVPKPLTCRSR
jgi:transposase